MTQVLIALLSGALFTPAEPGFLIPVLSASGEQAYTTTLFSENSTLAERRCNVYGAGGLRTLRVAPQAVRIDQRFLSALNAAALIRTDCDGEVTVYSRIQRSRDGGRTFDRGRLFAPLTAAPARNHRLAPAADLVVGEVTGQAVEVRLVIRHASNVTDDAVLSIPANGIYLVNLGFAQPTDVAVTLDVVAGAGSIAVGEAVSDEPTRRRLETAERIATPTAAQPVHPVTRLLVASSFKAAPFHDPATGLIYMRERWYDPRTGTFITPDPMGYRDASNLYAYCGGDPVNCSDPTGLAGYFFDGTDNDRDRMPRPTNVAKLAEKYHERVFYREGVGSTAWTLPLGGLTGLGGDRRLDWMYGRLVDQYNRGDTNIDIFGFSRGAALAIAFANMIGKQGIPDLSSATKELVRTPAGTVAVRRYLRFFNPTIRFLGIFDAVGSFGIPGDCSNPGYDLSRPSNVAVIRHATSRDEQRRLFPLTSVLNSDGSSTGNVIEQSFRGAHSDVGGGYSDNDELSRIPLGWMAEQAVNAGVPLSPFAPSEITAAPNSIQHDESGWIEQRARKSAAQRGERYSRLVCYSHAP